MLNGVRAWLREQLADQITGGPLQAASLDWYDKVCAEVAEGVTDTRFCTLISMASRKARRQPASLPAEALESAAGLLAGWNPQSWSILDLIRVGIILSRSDLESESASKAILGAVQHADVGELCALYRSFQFLPRSADYTWQATEACRTNMTEVFLAIACDNPFTAANFDDVAWRSLAIKALFVEAPLWRVHDLDGRMGEELCIVALDLADERRSANRPVQPELWLCLSTFGGQRGLESMELEMRSGPVEGRSAAAFGLARAGHTDTLEGLRSTESDTNVLAAIERALAGHHSQSEFRPLHTSYN